MNQFIKRLLVFSLSSAFLLSAFIYFYICAQGSLNHLPAPSLTDSYSYNDKLNFCRGKKADYVCIGSSLSLNNIDSKTCVQQFHSESYLNLSSWGLNMVDIYTLLKSYSFFSKPKKLIISSNIIDFRSKEPKKIDRHELDCFFSTPTPLIGFYYIKHSTLKGLLDDIKNAKVNKQTNSTYESLVYDSYGAAPLNKNGFNINKNRWNDSTTGPVENIEYAYLDSISNFCKSNNIQMLFFQSPIREGLYNKIDRISLKDHTLRTALIIEKYKHIYVNALESNWHDSLFVDGTHLNSTGARMYTEYCFRRVNE